eukprot:TRINITY_DN71986_c0_g1_i1.p1 TRINITY_DN71986_c0_g1~~TRINITY_DN71986_c0_g1_i1.p1  ORF type:complete len:550 (-),score=120.74 TRINITY_DN71986_c0_g1_i1:136-1785(-)
MSSSQPVGPLLVISGIPSKLHVPDLRAFFAPAVEAGLFERFHFRRPSGDAAKASASQRGRRGAAAAERDEQEELECVVAAADDDAAARILRGFQGTPWREVLVAAPVDHSAACRVARAAAATKEQHSALLARLAAAPPALPKGNIGTPRAQVLAAIRAGRIPPAAVPRLLGTGEQRRTLTSWQFNSIPPPVCWHAARGAAARQAALADAETEHQPMEELPGDDTAAAAADIESKHLPRGLDEAADLFDEPLEKAPYHQKTDRLHSAAGYLFEDVIENIWDKQDASGLVHYTDAAFWDRMAGDLDERCHDAWDVEEEAPDSDCASAFSTDDDEERPGDGGTQAPPHRRGHLRKLVSVKAAAEGFAAVRKGVAGRLMRKWGGYCGAQPSDTLRAVTDGLQPNTSRSGLGFAGQTPTTSFKQGRTRPRCRFGQAAPLCHRPRREAVRRGHNADESEADDIGFTIGARAAVHGEWLRVGTIFDGGQKRRDDDDDEDDTRSDSEMIKRRRTKATEAGRVRGSFTMEEATALAAKARAAEKVRFVAASLATEPDC